MSYNLHVVRMSDFVKLDPRGKPDMDESLAALSGLAAECIRRGIDYALLDVRDVQSGFTLTQIYRLAKAFHETGFRKEHRLAVLHRYSAGENAEFFAMTANDQGWNVKAFENYEDAMAWFSTVW